MKHSHSMNIHYNIHTPCTKRNYNRFRVLRTIWSRWNVHKINATFTWWGQFGTQHARIHSHEHMKLKNEKKKRKSTTTQTFTQWNSKSTHWRLRCDQSQFLEQNVKRDTNKNAVEHEKKIKVIYNNSVTMLKCRRLWRRRRRRQKRWRIKQELQMKNNKWMFLIMILDIREHVCQSSNESLIRTEIRTLTLH